MSGSRSVWVKVRATAAERAEWHRKAGSAGLSLSDLVRQAIGRVRTWTVAYGFTHNDVDLRHTIA